MQQNIVIVEIYLQYLHRLVDYKRFLKEKCNYKKRFQIAFIGSSDLKFPMNWQKSKTKTKKFSYTNNEKMILKPNNVRN